jgi:hypothetical protein
MDVDNPYKKLGGGALDQHLFEKSTTPEEKTGRKPAVQAAPLQKKRRRETPSTPPPAPTTKRNTTAILTSNHVSNKASKQVSNEETRGVSIEESILAALHTTALKANTFRYTQAELDFIRDVVYEAEVKYKTKLDKNDVARLGLEWLMVDWTAHKETSLLARILTSKKTTK